MPGMRLIWIMKGATGTSILFTRTAIELLKAARDETIAYGDIHHFLVAPEIDSLAPDSNL